MCWSCFDLIKFEFVTLYVNEGLHTIIIWGKRARASKDDDNEPVVSNSHGISDTVFEMTPLESDPQCVRAMTTQPDVRIDEWVTMLDIDQLEKLKHMTDKYSNMMFSDTAIRAFADLYPDMAKSQDL